jgi:hypothetical protein
MIKSIYSKDYMLADTFTHAVVNFVNGKRIFVGQLSACEKLVSTNHRYICARVRPARAINQS